MEQHLSSATKRRLNLNASHVLIFKYVTLAEDNTTYLCWVEQQLKAIYHLRIDPASITEDIVPWLRILLASYGVNLLVVVGGVLLQHQKKVKQVTKKKAHSRHNNGNNRPYRYH